MAILETLVKVVMALAVVAYVSYPLLRGKVGEDEDEAEMPEELADLYHRKEATYAALKELEFDYRTGKLSESDFKHLEERYRADGIELLEAIETAEGEEAEGGTSGAKRKGAGVPGQGPAHIPAAPSPGLCGSCGTVNDEGAKFCATCGERLKAGEAPGKGRDQGVPVCSACGEEVKAGAKFCGSCGAEVDS